METKPKSLIVVDGYGFVFRSWHTQPPLSAPDGMPVSAIYGFTSMLMKLLTNLEPEKIVIVFDSGHKNFRHDMYPAYKANRPAAPQELKVQFPVMRQVAQAFNIPVMEKIGFEADDVIATICARARKNEEEVVVVSSDKDLLQLMNHHIKIYDPVKTKYISAADVIAKFGVNPEQMLDALSLIGDSSDNIPGASGIGPKTAAKLLSEFKKLDTLYESLDQIQNQKLREKLSSSRDNVFLSRSLIKLDDNVDVHVDIDALEFKKPDAARLSDFLHKYGFKSLYKRAQALSNGQMQIKTEQDNTGNNANHNLTEIKDRSHAARCFEQIMQSGKVALAIILDENKEEILILSLEDGNSFFVRPAQFEDAKDFILKILSEQSINKIVNNLKHIWDFLSSPDIKYSNCNDLDLTGYLLSAGAAKRDIELPEKINEAAQKLAGYFDIITDDLRKLQTQSILHLYREVDLTLAPLLRKMEIAGIKADKQLFAALSKEFSSQISTLEEKIFALSGSQFNIGSPKQLAEILFDKMGLPAGKKLKKSQTYSTGVDVLENLQHSGYEIAGLILEWRHLSKLKNTYTDALPQQISENDGRIHTEFLQTSTSTGRLSSHEPNLQNIPIRTEQGQMIRKCFIAEPGCKLISADYSQIELRILAHISGDSALIDAFKKDEDIHSATASFIFGSAIDQVTPDQRRKAKAINFGIIYGLSAFGLAKNLGITTTDAQKYIKEYFARHRSVEQYMHDVVLKARDLGYTSNIIGRRCYFPSIKSGNAPLRQFSERAAINAPIQSTNADMIKIAMINIDKQFEKQGLKSRLILQIHDELLIETLESEIAAVIPILRRNMKNAIALRVPITVDVKLGDNWREMKKWQ